MTKSVINDEVNNYSARFPSLVWSLVTWKIGWDFSRASCPLSSWKSICNRLRQQDEKTQKANKKTNQILIFNVSRRGGETLLITARKFSRFDIPDCSEHEHEHRNNEVGGGKFNFESYFSISHAIYHSVPVPTRRGNKSVQLDRSNISIC